MNSLTPAFTSDTPPAHRGAYLCSNLSEMRIGVWDGLSWTELPEGFAVALWMGRTDSEQLRLLHVAKWGDPWADNAKKEPDDLYTALTKAASATAEFGVVTGGLNEKAQPCPEAEPVKPARKSRKTPKAEPVQATLDLPAAKVDIFE